jgi:AcrR family transcriptional regulator
MIRNRDENISKIRPRQVDLRNRNRYCQHTLPRGREAHQLPPGRHGLSRTFVAQNQRERILAAVADVTSAASYAEMTVEDIIVTAGVSRRTFYEHFKNKDDAFLAAYDEAAGRLLSAVRAAYESREGFADRIHTGISTFLGLLAADPAFARMCIVEVMAAGPEAVQRRNAAMKSFATMIEENAQQLLAEPPPSKLTSETVVGGIYDVIYTRIQRGEVRQLPELASDLVQSALLNYLPAGDPEGAS